MNASKLWQDIVKVALVGSDRQSLALPTNDTGPLAELLKRVETDPPAGYLLRIAGTLAVYQRAGFRPSPLNLTNAVAPAPPEAEDLPPCGPLARRLLGRLLAGEQKAVFPEYLARAAAAGQRIAAEFLPQLLDRGKRESQLRPLILPVLGKRGQWLATHNPDWDYAIAVGDAELDLGIWQTGSKHARLSLLRELRQRDPERARELVISTWKSEKADLRATQLEVLAANLSMADEPWLETLLDDRSKQVRQASAELLVTLPESQLCQRAIARATPLLKVRESQPNIAVELPSEPDAAMERDGILPKPPPHTRIGEKAWWLQQMLGMVPPQHWCQQLQNSPRTLIRGVGPKWQGVLVKGWVDATVRYRDEEWAEALLQPEFFRFLPEFAAHLMPILPRDRQQALCLQLLQIPQQEDLPPKQVGNFLTSDLLEHCQGPWPLELVDAAIAYFASILTRKENRIQTYRVAHHLSTMALNFPIDSLQKAPEISERIAQIFQGASPSDRRQHLPATDGDYYLRPFRDCLEFRQQLQQAFPKSTATV